MKEYYLKNADRRKEIYLENYDKIIAPKNINFIKR